jgi:hypothetical protein
MILSWKDNGAFATASNRLAYGRRDSARFARPIIDMDPTGIPDSLGLCGNRIYAVNYLK